MRIQCHLGATGGSREEVLGFGLPHSDNNYHFLLGLPSVPQLIAAGSSVCHMSDHAKVLVT